MIDWRVTYQSDSVRAKPPITVHIHLELFKCSPGTTSLYHTKFMDSSISNPEKRDDSQIGAIGVLKASFMFLFNYMIIHYWCYWSTHYWTNCDSQGESYNFIWKNKNLKRPRPSTASSSNFPLNFTKWQPRVWYNWRKSYLRRKPLL